MRSSSAWAWAAPATVTARSEASHDARLLQNGGNFGRSVRDDIVLLVLVPTGFGTGQEPKLWLCVYLFRGSCRFDSGTLGGFTDWWIELLAAAPGATRTKPYRNSCKKHARL